MTTKVAVAKRNAMDEVARHLDGLKVCWLREAMCGGIDPGAPNIIVFESWMDSTTPEHVYGFGLAMCFLSRGAKVTEQNAHWLEAFAKRGFKTAVVASTRAAMEFFDRHFIPPRWDT